MNIWDYFFTFKPNNDKKTEIPIDSEVELNRLDNLDNLQVFPNPSVDGIFYLRIPEMSGKRFNVIIYDFIGQKIQELSVINSEGCLLDLQHLSAGIYYIKIIILDKQELRKIIILK